MKAEFYGRLRRSVELLGIEKNDRILNVGCKDAWLEELAKGRCKEIIGIDINTEAISRNNKKIKNKTVRFLRVDITEKTPFKNRSFDKVCFLDVIEHLPQGTEVKALKEINRVLKNDGVLILSTPNNNLFCKFTDPGYWVLGHRHYDSDFIRDMLKKSNFEVEHFEIGGKLIESLTLPFFALFWFLKSDIPFKNFINHVIDDEYNGTGWYTIMITARKVSSVE
jgi:SAM-dependent methyltransferase